MIANRLGAQWLLYPNDWIDNRLLIGRPFEREQLAFAQMCIDDYEIDHFFDCGANIGLYSVLLGKRASRLKSINAFEPVKKTWSRLTANLGLNGLLDKATPHNYGLGEAEAMHTIAIENTSTGTATLDSGARLDPKRDFRNEEDVLIKVFDENFGKYDAPCFVKIDVEGHEVSAMQGMRTFLNNNRCVLQIEVWAQFEDPVKELLDNQGYRLIHQIGHDFYFSNMKREPDL